MHPVWNAPFDRGVDAIMMVLPPPPMHSAESVADALIPVIRSSPKPVVIALLGSHLTEAALEAFGAADVPTYGFPERAASALAALHRRAVYLARERHDSPIRPFKVQETRSHSALDTTAAYGIRTLPLRLVQSPEEAAATAREMGFPIVMKIARRNLHSRMSVGE
jgi:acyl-CoA synthetase (NDP forming)